MNPAALERFREVEEIFYAAIERPPGVERDTLIEELCAANENLRADVTLLIEGHERIRAAAPSPSLRLPRFGAWQAVKLLGRGGMGTVYLAERADGAFRMSAAVKVVPLAMASHEIEERFRRERQFLASLDHPKVARLIDGGVSETGLPYLVMEFVEGLTVDCYCDAHRLDTRARIAVVRQVLDALAYVHGRHVIHRDVKPSNLLVDESGNVKLLDFGIARLVDATAETALTKTGVFAFTPEYASPEQVHGEPVTFASDLYSAGVLLYLLLTGSLPHRIERLPAAGPANTVAVERLEPPRLDAPLEAILAKALSGNAAGRYQFAAEMDADLVRYLEGEPVRARASARRVPRRVWALLAAGLLAFGGLAGALKLFRSHSVGDRSSIVVLPFASSGADPSKEYFAEGLTDEITDQLVRVKSLRVVAHTSAFVFKGKRADPREVSRQLHVTHILEGRVAWSGEQIRISAHLERASDGSLVWSETYDRPARNLLTVQSEIAEAVARVLQVNSGTSFASRHIPAEEAHDLFLRATFDLEALTPDAVKRAEQGLERAVRIDPEYAAAWARLAVAKFGLAAVSGRAPTPAEVRDVKDLYRKALTLDPDLAEAHANLGLIAMNTDWDWAGAERELRLASRNGPSVPAENTYGLLLAYRGRFGEADRRMAAALSIDPLNSVTITYVGAVRYWEGRFPEAIALNRQLLEHFPGQLNPRVMLNLTYIEAGQAELALADIRPLAAKFPPSRVLEVMALAHLGRREEALRLLRQLEAEYGQDQRVFRQWFALAWASLRDHAQTVKWLEKSAELREFQVLNLAVNPAFAQMRNDPAFVALVKRIGLK
jgi:serine/threonine protein kinase/Tfp pilus assembly protein PilF